MSPSKETEVKMPSLIPVVQNYHVDEEEEEGEYWDLWDEDTLFFGTTSSGLGSGEGPSTNPNAQHFTVTVSDPGCVNGPREDGYKGGNTGATVQIEVPEDRYVLFEMEDQGHPLPYACRMGCCTACAVRVKSGSLRQTHKLGVSDALRREGYALLCVSYPESDVDCELVNEDEVYVKQFGQYFARNKIVRDDYALELAEMDE